MAASAHANDRLGGKLLMGVARLGSASNDRLSISVTLLHNLHTAFLYTPHPRLPQLISLLTLSSLDPPFFAAAKMQR